jgi:hypothetical protein
MTKTFDMRLLQTFTRKKPILKPAQGPEKRKIFFSFGDYLAKFPAPCRASERYPAPKRQAQFHDPALGFRKDGKKTIGGGGPPDAA